MADERANIDLLFRNGLKDFEVLPPPEVWNNILPIIRKKQRSLVFLRTAALIAILLSISFLAYQLSRQIPSSFNEPVISFGQDQIFSQAVPADPALARIVPSGDRMTASPGSEIQAAPLTGINADSTDGQTGLQAFVTETNPPDFSSNLLVSSSLIDFRLPESVSSESNTFYNPAYDPAVEEAARKNDKWTLTAMASPMYYMRPGSPGEQVPGSFPLEQSRMSYSGGLGFSYKISRKLSIQSGLYYSSIGNEVDNIQSFSGFRQFDYTKGDHNFQVVTSAGIIQTDNPDVFLTDNMSERVVTRYTRDVFDATKAGLPLIDNSLYQNFGYLEMPVVLRYKVVDRGIDFNLIGGMSYNLLVNNSVHAMIEGSKYDIGKTAGLNSILVSSTLGMGMEYTLSDKISLNLEPTFRYFLNPFSSISGVASNPYSFGIFSGLSYRF